MTAELRQALQQLLGARVSEESEGWVLVPSSERELASIIRLFRRHETSLPANVCISRRHFDAIELIEPRSAIVALGAGVVLQRVEQALEPHRLTLGPLSPSAWRLEVGTFLESAYAGLRSAPGGRLEPVSLSLKAMMPDELIYQSLAAPRSAAGPDLDALFLGGGGRAGLIMGASLRCRAKPNSSRVARHTFPKAAAAVAALRGALSDGVTFENARMERRSERILLEVTVVGNPESVENDVFTLVHHVFPHGGRLSGHTLASPPPGIERECSWDAIAAAADAGRPLSLYRLAVDSAIAVGDVDGMPLPGGSPWPETFPPHLWSAVDPACVLGGRP